MHFGLRVLVNSWCRIQESRWAADYHIDQGTTVNIESAAPTLPLTDAQSQCRHLLTFRAVDS